MGKENAGIIYLFCIFLIQWFVGSNITTDLNIIVTALKHLVNMMALIKTVPHWDIREM